MSIRKVNAVVEKILVSKQVSFEDTAQLDRAMGSHRTAGEREAAHRVSDALNAGSVRGKTGEDLGLLESSLALLDNVGGSRLASFGEQVGAALVFPFLYAITPVADPDEDPNKRQNRSLFNSSAVMIGAAATVGLAPVTLVVGAVLGVVAALRD